MHWYRPNLLEKEYSKHIIGKSELKSKIGRLMPQGMPFAYTVHVDRFDNLGESPKETILMSKEYAIPMDIDAFMSDLMDISLTHNIVEVDPDNGRIYLNRSKNGRTNISGDIVGRLLHRLTSTKPPGQTTTEYAII